jgi:hypothetical protein
MLSLRHVCERVVSKAPVSMEIRHHHKTSVNLPQQLSRPLSPLPPKHISIDIVPSAALFVADATVGCHWSEIMSATVLIHRGWVVVLILLILRSLAFALPYMMSKSHKQDPYDNQSSTATTPTHSRTLDGMLYLLVPLSI